MDLQDPQGDHHLTRALVLLPEGWPLPVVPCQCLVGTKHSCLCVIWGRSFQSFCVPGERRWLQPGVGFPGAKTL